MSRRSASEGSVLHEFSIFFKYLLFFFSHALYAYENYDCSGNEEFCKNYRWIPDCEIKVSNEICSCKQEIHSNGICDTANYVTALPFPD